MTKECGEVIKSLHLVEACAFPSSTLMDTQVLCLRNIVIENDS